MLARLRGQDVEPADAERHQRRDDEGPAMERGRAAPGDDCQRRAEYREDQTSHELRRPGPVAALPEDEHREQRCHRGIPQQGQKGRVDRAGQVRGGKHRELHPRDQADPDPRRPLPEELEHDAAVSPVRRPRDVHRPSDEERISGERRRGGSWRHRQDEEEIGGPEERRGEGHRRRGPWRRVTLGHLAPKPVKI